MEFEEKPMNNIVVVKIVTRRFVASDSMEFGKKLSGYARDYRFLILDLSEIQFMDSFGIGSLLEAYKLFRQKGELVVCDPSQPVKNLLELSGMSNLIRIFPNVVTAISILTRGK